MTNVVQCPKCERWLISEEIHIHQCQSKTIDIKYNWFVKTNLHEHGEVLLIEGHDGTFYRITPFIPPKSKHPNFTPHDSTEPNFTLCYVTFYRKPSIMI